MDFKIKKPIGFFRKALPAGLMLVILSVAVFGPASVEAEVPSVSTLVNCTLNPAGCLTSITGLNDIGLNVLTKAVLYMTFSMMNWAAGMLTIVGFGFDFVVNYTISGFANLAGNTGIVGIGWTILRDLSNLVFIFLILCVAISTILGLHHGSAMGSVLRIVIAAILINFSLFVTKAVIDVANIVALHFYNLITANTGAGGINTLSGVFMSGLGLQSFFDHAAIAWNAPDVDLKLSLTFLFGALLMTVAAWMFFAATVMFLVRTLYLIVLMIFSPFAFIAWVVPGLEG